MSWEIAFVLIVVGGMIGCLIFEVARPDMIVFVTLSILTISGILTPEEAMKGFSNQAMLTIAMLFMIAGVIQESGILERFIRKLLHANYSTRKVLVKLLFPLSGMSALLNNTPIVITLTPIIRNWCKERDISPSKLLIPLSYATILGGTITLMGTSTNLIVHGLLQTNGFQGFSFFQLSMIGVPITLLGIFYLTTIGYHLLPNHPVMVETVQEHSREYLGEVIVENHYPSCYQSIYEAGLRHLKGIYFIAIVRGHERISPIKSTTVIQPGDRLIFTGMISTISELQNIKGLRLETNSDLCLDTIRNHNTRLIEVVVSHHSSLLYKKIKDTQFRGKFDAAVIAVHRKNERIHSKIGDIMLKPGDTLLIIAGSDFHQRNDGQDFYIATPIQSNVPTRQEVTKGWIAITILSLMIALVTFHLISMFTAVLMTTVLLLLFRTLSPDEAKNHIQFNVLLLIASSLGIGTALTASGAAQWLANSLVSIMLPFGTFAVLSVIYFMTNVFTEVLTNNAAAVIMFPIALEVANQLQIDPYAVAVIIAIAASASFSSPIGYQTNLIVYGPGGYVFKDYLKVGIPLNIIVMVTTLFMVNQFWILS